MSNILEVPVRDAAVLVWISRRKPELSAAEWDDLIQKLSPNGKELARKLRAEAGVA